jgi:asparagine synthetase B (glutamine-hydrolysing)
MWIELEDDVQGHGCSDAAEELESARAVASHFGLEHVIVQSTTSDFVENAVRMMWVNDEPIADPAYYSAMKIAE